jgi:hypothetical protein
MGGGASTLLRWHGRVIWARVGRADMSGGVGMSAEDEAAGWGAWSLWGGGAAFSQGGAWYEGPNPQATAAAAAVSGTMPVGSLSLLVLRRPFFWRGRGGEDDRGDAAVAALLAEGERLSSGEGAFRFTQVYLAACQPANGAWYWADAGRRRSRPISRRAHLCMQRHVASLLTP